MHNIKWIRENPDVFDQALARRGLPPVSDKLLNLDKQHRSILTTLQDIQTERNDASKKIGALKSGGSDATHQISKIGLLKKKAAELEENQRQTWERLSKSLEILPNMPDSDVPDGKDEDDNVEIRAFGEKPVFDFNARDHVEIGEVLGLLDFDLASKLSGSRFVVTFGGLAKLERAIATFMLDLHTSQNGYFEVNPPALVREEIPYGTGQLPKFADDLFKTTGNHWLIPTAEVPLTNIVAGKILDAKDLPIRYTANTPCFRAEAGAAGKDTRGMLRQHQFQKVELVSIVEPENSNKELERMTSCAEEVLKQLELPYRVVMLSTGDLGFSAKKTYDLEVWLPGQKRYREISSCSNCGNFQARRMNSRFRKEGQKGTEFVHTLNGSGLAIGRTLIAILENYQQHDGSVVIPNVLRPLMANETVLNSNSSN